MNIFTWIIMVTIVVIPIAVNYVISLYIHRPFVLQAKTIIIPVICGAIYPIARMLPEPNINAESITLVQHFVGGGFVSALYFVYFIREYDIKLPFWLYMLLLYPFVSMMGVTNELLEFSATKFGLYQLDGSDVWWDLTSNTLGAYALLTLLLGAQVLKGKKPVD